MSSTDSTRLEVINHLVKYVIEKLPRDEAPLLKHFMEQYYLSVSSEDLTSRSILDLYGAVLSHWHYIYQRMPGESKVRVYNPKLEEHGWQSKHTIIEISHDDMPFLVDSVCMELNRQDINIHLIIHMGSIKLRRNKQGQVIEVLPLNSEGGDFVTEAPIYVEIDRISDPKLILNVENGLRQVLQDVRTVVNDWPKMQEQGTKVLSELEVPSPFIDPEELSESFEFFRWLIADHFTFMGYRRYTLVGEGEKRVFELVPGTSLGLFKEGEIEIKPIAEMSESAQKLIDSKQLLMLGKTNDRSTVHRPAFTDFIVVKILNKKGELVGAHRFVGLYTSVAYNSSLKQIPYLRRKLSIILTRAGFPPRGHDDRALLNIMENLPRDDVFEANENELLSLSTGILYLQERQKIRVFIRRDTYGRFYSCLVFVPREKFNSALRQRMQDILLKGLSGTEVTFSTQFSESSLARIHFIVRVDPHQEIAFDVKSLEEKLIEAGRTWKDDLSDALVEHCGEERGNELFKRYGDAFPASYTESFSARMAVVDIEYFEMLSETKSLVMSLYRPLEDPENTIRFKLFRKGLTIPLSDVVPILENMELRIISERPYELNLKEGDTIWINDYRMLHSTGEAFNSETIKEIFQEAFDHIWRGKAENDGFNRLVLVASLSWREIMVLRAYAKYLWQTGFVFSHNYIADTFAANANIAALLIRLFKCRFDPDIIATESEIVAIKDQILAALEGVSNLNEDRILRQYLDAIMATLRTNYFQHRSKGGNKSYFSFKIESAKIPELPLPLPLYEVFVYSPRVEAIHLRGAKVARGGIRWSDRREDFRTEILGLMKAQQVKNAVIIPMGAKGGFVVKQMPEEGTRDQIMNEVIACYKTFIRGLLDLTDNYQGNKVIVPDRVVRYDDDDPYLVVAADKGTATFSDIANELSKEYGFWLGDAFASGGKTGYDHKKMAITARGAWESVKRHFQELSTDIETTDFTVLGIGDMSGDVFGNGMLLSQHIKLVAAFNHMHIFLDPNPDPKISFKERERLFNLPRSTWGDYNLDLISKGGGIYLRSLKSITLSPEIRAVLDFHKERVQPNELIREILKAPVDLFWNGGIGTYVKSSIESNTSVGDRTNDALRVDGRELRCQVVAEGGNLGFTQLGRVEYAKLGGRLNTDAIDNSGGVNCSDYEVNIKILLNEIIEIGELTEKQRNELLALMQDEVAELVLNNNRLQTKAISVAVSQAGENLGMYSRILQEMEQSGNIDRALEFLADKEELDRRKALKQGFTRPEIAVLMAYSKALLKKALLSSDFSENTYVYRSLEHYFPKPLQKQFKQYMQKHRLKCEIIATQVSNFVVNEMGITFVSRLQDETGAQPADIIRAYIVAREVFEVPSLQEAIDNLKSTVDASVQLKMLQEVNRLVRRGARWFLRNRRTGMDITETIKHFGPRVKEVSDSIYKLLAGASLDSYDAMAEEFKSADVPEALAYRISGMNAMFSALDIVEAATQYKFMVEKVAVVYYRIGIRLKLGWFRDLIKRQPITSHWESIARATFRDDLDRLQCNLTVSILQINGNKTENVEELINIWVTRHKDLVERWEYFVAELQVVAEPEFTMFSVALRELVDMAQI